MDGQILSLIGDVFNAWLPWFFLLASCAAAFAVGRFWVVMFMQTMGVRGVPESKTGYQPLIFAWLLPTKEPPAAPAPEPPAGPWYKSLGWELQHSLQSLWQTAVQQVRGNPANPWWRLSFRGLERAFSQASWSVFFALFFGAFVCAAAVAAGYPFAATLAIYALLGIIWTMVLATVTICLWIAEVSYLVVGLFCEMGAFIGFWWVATVVLTIGYLTSLILRRGRLYAATVYYEMSEGLWYAQPWDEKKLLAEMEIWRTNKEQARARRDIRRDAARARWLAKPYRRRLLDFAAEAVITGMMIIVFVLLGIAVSTPIFEGTCFGTMMLLVISVVLPAYLIVTFGMVYAKRSQWDNEAKASGTPESEG